MDVNSLTDAALKKLWAQGFDALDQRDQLLVTIWGVEADVNNGGFHQYYNNSYGDQARGCPDVLRAIGASRMAALVEEANAAFGPEGPPTDREARQERLDEIEESAESTWSILEREFWQYPDDISLLLQSHMKALG